MEIRRQTDSVPKEDPLLTWNYDRIAPLLSEGVGLRPLARAFEMRYATVYDFAVRLGKGCRRVHDKAIRDIPAKWIVLDEMWGYVYAKEATRKERKWPKSAPAGDRWLFVAMDGDTRLVISFWIGRQGKRTADKFVQDLRGRIDMGGDKPVIVSDGTSVYEGALAKHFGKGSIHYGKYVKSLNGHQLEKPIRKAVWGEPPRRLITTSRIEAKNTGIRAGVRRLTREGIGYSKTIENHMGAIATYFCYYNFVRVHTTLRTTPSVAADIATARVTNAEMRRIAGLYHANRHLPWPPLDMDWYYG